MKYNRSVRHYLGVDCGSVSLKIVVMDQDKNIIWKDYQRTHGKPIDLLNSRIKKMFEEIDIMGFEAIITTGSARNIMARIINGKPVNEITTHGLAGAFFHPEAKTIIEIGGQDSKLISLDKDDNDETIVSDSAMNDICAAGTGSFLDQQAFRMGITIEELSTRAFHSANPAKIAGRCSVFAKTDMIHLQQEGVSKEDISAGLCEAVVRTYIENLIKGKEIRTPLLFQGGVANNMGMKKALVKLFGLYEKDIIIPDHFDILGAIGAALYAVKKNISNHQEKDIILKQLKNAPKFKIKDSGLSSLSDKYIKKIKIENNRLIDNNWSGEVYIGIDAGSVSAKIAVIDKDKNLIFKHYTPINGDPFNAVKWCINAFHKEYSKDIKVKGVGVTGSGRDFIANVIGVDIVKNEITAQAAATVRLVPDVDTIIEIGGQDSKYIKIKNKTVVNFIMNKTCAAGTGSFLAEQADRLGVDLRDDFSVLAMKSTNPVDMGTRCTVFMETDCIHYQQNNIPRNDILAGLSYSIAKNYLEKVSGNLRIGDKVLFQGGVAFNKSVAAAFGHILNKDIIIAPHHEITGALGIAYITAEETEGINKFNPSPFPLPSGERVRVRGRGEGKGEGNIQIPIHKSNFIGFELENRIAEKKSIHCKRCANLCRLVSVRYNDGHRSIYASNCGRFEKDRVHHISRNIPDYFKKREKLLLSYRGDKDNDGKEVIGIPRMLLFYELFPMWAAFFNEIGYSIKISGEYSRQIYEKGLSKIVVDTCFPIKAIYGAMEELVESGVCKIFLPYIFNMQDEGYKTKYAHNCQYIQQIPDFIRASMDLDLITPTIKMKDNDNNIEEAFIELAKQLNVSKKSAVMAIKKAMCAQNEFIAGCKDIGRDALDYLNRFDKVFVLIGHPYIIHDRFFNLNISRRLSKLGIPTISADMLPLDRFNKNAKNIELIWKTNNRAVNASEFIHEYNLSHDNKLLPILMTTFGCAADSMLTPYLSKIFGDDPWLEIEIDEHNSITGILTRCEAFWESVKVTRKTDISFSTINRNITSDNTIMDIIKEQRTLYIPQVSEAFVTIKEILQNSGVKSELIPETSLHSNMLGRKYSNEKHCRTYQVILGDYMATTMRDNYNPDKSVFFTFGYTEACRLSLFKSLHEMVIKDKVGGDIWLFGPRLDDPTDWIRKFGAGLAIDLWIGLICHDYLSRYRYQIRPYEKIEGSTDRTYLKAVEMLSLGVKKRNMIRYFRLGMDLMQKVETIDRDLVKIGVVGDAFTRVHKYGIQRLFDGIERMGGVVILPPSWHDFVNYGSERLAHSLWKKKRYGKAAMRYIGSYTLNYYKKRIEEITDAYSEMFPDQSNDWLTTNSVQYVNPEVAPVIPSMFIGKCVDFVEKRNVDGLLNAYGFNCVLGKISTACFNRLRISNGNIPMLTFIDDGLQQTNILTRLEAFMEQTRRFKRQHRKEI
ncbi:MAG: acyl-CoA dehydratase activase [Nitrospirota bacterium]